MNIKKQKGFTLIELMIVIAIIGILASIAIPQFAKFRIKAFNSAAIADAKNTGTMMEAFNSDYYVYPNAVALAVANSLTLTGTVTGVTVTDLVVNLSAGVDAGIQAGAGAANPTSGRCVHTKHIGGDTVITWTTAIPTVTPGATVVADLSKDITAVTTTPTCL